VTPSSLTHAVYGMAVCKSSIPFAGKLMTGSFVQNFGARVRCENETQKQRDNSVVARVRIFLFIDPSEFRRYISEAIVLLGGSSEIIYSSNVE